MADANKDEILSILKKSTGHKEETDLKDDIKEVRNTLRTITNLIITSGVGILAVIVTLILK